METLRLVLVTMRPKQWTKNLILFAPLIFAGDLLRPGDLARVTAAFAIFCLISGAVYIVNDIVDRDRDRAHAKKARRPIARGDLSVTSAALAAALLLVVALAGSIALGRVFTAVAVGYALLQLAYSLFLKHQVILDVMAIAAGFVLRVFAGAVLIGLTGSAWLYVCASLLALFLGFGKRRHELLELGQDALDHRSVLNEYTPALLDALLSSITAATIVTYALYTFSSQTAELAPLMVLTVPFVAYGLFRYLYLVYKRNLGGNPEEILLTDAPLIIDIGLWLLTVLVLLYVSN